MDLSVYYALLFLIIAVSLFVVMWLLTKKSSSDRYNQSSIQLLGEKDYQVEWVYTVSDKHSSFAVISSGTQDTKASRNISVFAGEAVKNAYLDYFHKSASTENFFKTAIDKANKTIADNVLEQNIRPDITAMLIKDGFLHVADIRDTLQGGAVYIYKNGALREIKNKKRISKLFITKVRLDGSEVVLMASKHAVSSLDERDILLCLRGNFEPIQKCEQLCDIILNKRLKEQGNVTIVVAYNQ